MGSAKTIHDIHLKRVLVNDFATGNSLVGSDLYLKFSDFSSSTIVPDSEKWVSYGFSMKHDVVHFGSLIYEIVSGKEFVIHINEYTDGSFPHYEVIATGTGVRNSFTS